MLAINCQLNAVIKNSTNNIKIETFVLQNKMGIQKGLLYAFKEKIFLYTFVEFFYVKTSE